MARKCRILALCCLLAFAVVSIAAGAETPAVSTADDQRELAMKYCNSCHTFVRVERAGGGLEGWADRIRRMNRWGARVPEPVIGRLASYLAQTYPVPSRMANLMAYTAELSFATVSVQPVQQILRVAAMATGPSRLEWGSAAKSCKDLSTGQRVRAFRPMTRGSVAVGRIEIVAERPGGECSGVAAFSTPLLPGERYLTEVLIERAPALAIPSEAILDEGDAQHVFVCDTVGACERRNVRTGRQGERLTEVLGGLRAGEQVATLGSHQLDAEARRFAVASGSSN